MAMRVDERLLPQQAAGILRRVLDQKFTQQERLASQPLRVQITRKQIRQLLPKHRRTTGFQQYDRRAGDQPRGHPVQNLSQPFLGRIKHAIIVQWPPAAHVLPRHFDAEAGILENLDRRLRYPGMKVVIERVRPKDDRRTTLVAWWLFVEPFLEALWCECGQSPFSRHADQELREAGEQRGLRKNVGKSRSNAREPGPAVDQAE